MVILCRSTAPPEEAPGTEGSTTASATWATNPRVATSNKKYNNSLANLATSVTQGLKSKLHLRPAFTMLPRSILGRRSIMAASRGASLRQGEGTIPTGTTTTTTTTSPPSPPTSLKNPIPRILNQSDPKYDGKQDPRQWIRCYSVAIEVSGGSNSTKALYFSVALESAPLTWLESLKPNSIDS
jgi:hypothetical protein